MYVCVCSAACAHGKTFSQSKIRKITKVKRQMSPLRLHVRLFFISFTSALYLCLCLGRYRNYGKVIQREIKDDELVSS